jgi:hypothetical protein
MKEKIDNFIQNLELERLRQIEWSNLLNWDYLTDPAPSEIFIYEQWLYIIILINFIIGLVFFTFVSRLVFEQKPKYSLIRRVSFIWIANTVFLLGYNLIRSEGVAFLSMRLFLVLLFSVYLVIVLYFIYYYFFLLPGRLEEFNQARLRDKYNAKRRR